MALLCQQILLMGNVCFLKTFDRGSNSFFSPSELQHVCDLADVSLALIDDEKRASALPAGVRWLTFDQLLDGTENASEGFHFSIFF